MASENRARILIVEDEVVIAALLQDLLEEAGFEICSVDNGEQALQAQLENPCHLAIVDYGLPDFNGLEVCERLGPAPSGQRPKIILATGWGLLDDDQTDGKVDLLLEKPFNMKKLISHVQALTE